MRITCGINKKPSPRLVSCKVRFSRCEVRHPWWGGFQRGWKGASEISTTCASLITWRHAEWGRKVWKPGMVGPRLEWPDMKDKETPSVQMNTTAWAHHSPSNLDVCHLSWPQSRGSAGWWFLHLKRPWTSNPLHFLLSDYLHHHSLKPRNKTACT